MSFSSGFSSSDKYWKMVNILINVLLLVLSVVLFIGIDLSSLFPTPPVDTECIDNVNKFLMGGHRDGCAVQDIDLVGNFACAIKAYGIRADDSKGAVTAALEKFRAAFCAYVTSMMENPTTDGIINARNLFKAATYGIIDVLTGGYLEDFLASDEAKPYNALVTGWEAFTTNAAQNPETAHAEIAARAKGEMIPAILKGVAEYNKKHILRLNLEISV